MDQTEKFNVLGEKPVGKLLMQYAIPAIVAMTASSIYNIIDGIFIGQGVGKEAIMGLALTAPVMSLTAAFGAMVGVGAATLMSVRLGQKDYATAKKILGNVLIMNIVMGVTLGFVLQLCLTPILRFFGASDATLPFAHDFMTIILAGNVVTHLYLGLNALLRSTNRPMKAMYATFGTVWLNCIFAPIFIFVLGWGIRGAATATVLAQFCMLLWQLKLFSSKNNLIHLSRDIFHPDTRIMRESLVIGLPPFLINLCACMVTIFITRSMTQYGGDVAVGAYGISNRLILFVVMIVIGLNQGMQPIVGYNYGARQFDRVIRTLKLNIVCAVCVTTFGFILGHFFPHLVAGMFTDDPTLLSVAEMGLKISLLAFPIAGFQIVSSGFFQYIGKPQKAILLSLTRQLLFLVPLLAVLPDLYGTMGVWASMPIADCLAAFLAGVLLFFQIRKMRRHPDEIKVI